jgi:WD40 repeat protein
MLAARKVCLASLTVRAGSEQESADMLHSRVAAICLVITGSYASSGPAAPFVPARDAQCVAFSPNGKLVATGTSGLSNGEYPPRPHPSVRKAAVINLWDVETGQKLRRMETYGDFTNLEFSPDGSKLFSSRLFTPGDGTQLNEVRIWDPLTGKPLHQFEGCHAFALPRQGEMLAVLSRSRCVIYDTATQTWLREIKPLGTAISVAFTPDGKNLVGICPAEEKFVIRACDAGTGKLLAQSAEIDEPFYTLSMGALGRMASGHAGGIVYLWNVDSLRPVARLTSGGRGLQHPFFSPDGTTLAAGDQDNGDVVFWNAANGEELQRYTFQRGSFRTHFPRGEETRIRPEKDPRRFVFSPDGTSFLAGCYGGIIRLVSTGQDTRRFGD